MHFFINSAIIELLNQEVSTLESQLAQAKEAYHFSLTEEGKIEYNGIQQDIAKYQDAVDKEQHTLSEAKSRYDDLISSLDQVQNSRFANWNAHILGLTHIPGNELLQRVAAKSKFNSDLTINHLEPNDQLLLNALSPMKTISMILRPWALFSAQYLSSVGLQNTRDEHGKNQNLVPEIFQKSAPMHGITTDMSFYEKAPTIQAIFENADTKDLCARIIVWLYLFYRQPETIQLLQFSIDGLLRQIPALQRYHLLPSKIVDRSSTDQGTTDQLMQFYISLMTAVTQEITVFVKEVDTCQLRSKTGLPKTTISAGIGSIINSELDSSSDDDLDIVGFGSFMQQKL